MARKLQGMRVAVIAADGFEQIEVTSPMRALQRHGAIPEIASGWCHPETGDNQPFSPSWPAIDVSRCSKIGTRRRRPPGASGGDLTA